MLSVFVLAQHKTFNFPVMPVFFYSASDGLVCPKNKVTALLDFLFKPKSRTNAEKAHLPRRRSVEYLSEGSETCKERAVIERNKSVVREIGRRKEWERERERYCRQKELSWLLGVMFDSIT